MSLFRRLHLILLVLGAGLFSGILASSTAYGRRAEDGVVRIHVSKKEVDKSSPWQFDAVMQQEYLGVVLKDGFVLTTAYAVADAAYIEVQQFGASRRSEAKVAFVDYEVNLALLRPAAGALEGARPVQLGGDIATDDHVDIYKARDAYQLTRLPASLQEVGLYVAATSSYSLATYLLKVQQTGLGWSEPVFRDGRLVALTTGQDANYVHALPMSIIRHFLKDRHGVDYLGFPALGVELSPLVSPDQRQLLGADKVAGGVRVADVLVGGSFAGLLQVDDVLLAIDGVAVSDHGFYRHPKWGEVHLKYLVNQHYSGDKVTLKIIRHGTPLDVVGVLRRFDSNRFPVVTYQYDQAVPHLIVGGFIFQELSIDYLEQWGTEWRQRAPFDLLYTLQFKDKPTGDPLRRVIFLTRVLADKFNRGYGDFRHLIVDTVNDRKVTSMSTLKEALRHPLVRKGGSYARIVFLRGGGEAILAYDGLSAANKRIAATYEIRTPASFFTWGG